MKIRPRDKNAWINALLFVTVTLFLIFNGVALLAHLLTPDWSPGYSEPRITFRFITGWSLLFAAICAQLLFIMSIFFAFQKDWRKAFAASFCVAIWTFLLAVIAPALTRAREKPVLYLYPEKEQRVNVKLQYDGALTHTYPEYSSDGWNVLAKPSGELVNLQTGRTHYCLFWEGRDAHEYSLDEGFLVAGQDTAAFLETALATLGLSEREANEFIIYWLPRMEKHRYNLISFPTDEYRRQVGLDITPTPDTEIRVFMVFKGVDRPVDIKPQKLAPVERSGFTAVEWGGTELR